MIRNYAPYHGYYFNIDARTLKYSIHEMVRSTSSWPLFYSKFNDTGIENDIRNAIGRNIRTDGNSNFTLVMESCSVLGF